MAMRIFSMNGRGGRIYAKPGTHPEGDPAEWYKDAKKTEPVQFQVQFDADGVAVVPDSLGKYLVAEGLARTSNLITAAGKKFRARA